MLWIYLAGCVVVFLGLSALFGAPYVPSRRRDIRDLFAYLPVQKGDVLLDLGSGDGVVLRAAAARGARAIGYEIHPLFVGVSRLLSRRVKDVTIHWANGWTAAFPSDVTIVYIFSVGRDGKRVERKLQHEADTLGRPLTLVCYGNALPTQAPTGTHGAYFIYTFQPLHPGKA